MIYWKKTMMAAALVMLFPISQSDAATAIVFGNSTVAVETDTPTVQGATVAAFETCSLGDRACRLLLTCSEPGHGAVWASSYQGVLDAVGATCGRPDSASAQSDAEQQCRATASLGTCTNRRVWLDRTR